MSSEPISSNSQTDWQRIDAMSDEDIDLSDCPEITPELFAKATVQRGGLPAAKNNTQVALGLSFSKVVKWVENIQHRTIALRQL